MEDIKNDIPVANQAAEKVETPTEETPKYTETQFNERLDALLGKKIARREEKLRREFDKERGEYEELVDILKAGTGQSTLPELKSTFRGFYADKGVKIPERSAQPNYSERDIKVLAGAEAKEIINSGIDEVVEEVDRLAALGADMTPRDKELFHILATHRKNHERSTEFAKLGITEDVYNSDAFQRIVGMSSSKTSAKDIVEVYQSTIPKKNIEPMGSMVSNTPQDNGIKDFYTVDEARKFTKADFDKNPALYQRVLESMRKW